MNSSLIINASETAEVNTTNFTLEYIQNVNLSNKNNEKDISEIIPFILMGAFIISVFIVAFVVLYKDNKHQNIYIESVKSRKRGDVVEWVIS